MEKEFPYKDLSYKRVGCFYDVYNEIGPGHKEQVYHKALQIVLEIKSTSMIIKVFEQQLYTYIKRTEYRIGYLVNFGLDKIMIKGKIFN